jgi:uncharacterized protein
MKKQKVQRNRRITKMDRSRDLSRLVYLYGNDIVKSPSFHKTKEHIQHGTITVHQHCKDVAKCSLAISKTFRIKCDQRALVRGALLHDYFLYDWHDKDHREIKNLHGFYHPGIALKNAQEHYDLTDIERDIIHKHMWPLTIVPPKYREGWIVTMADKYCSLLETVRIRRGRKRGISK